MTPLGRCDRKLGGVMTPLGCCDKKLGISWHLWSIDKKLGYHGTPGVLTRNSGDHTKSGVPLGESLDSEVLRV